jgi:hypothetical protein
VPGLDDGVQRCCVAVRGRVAEVVPGGARSDVVQRSPGDVPGDGRGDGRGDLGVVHALGERSDL